MANHVKAFGSTTMACQRQRTKEYLQQGEPLIRAPADGNNMKLNVGVIDYGMGNLHSVAKRSAARSPRHGGTAARLKTPICGVAEWGAFGAAMTTPPKKVDDFICHDW